MNKKAANLIEARTLKGFRDVLPDEALLKTQLLDTVRGVLSSFGYVPIETPHLEYTEALIGEAQGDIGKELYRFKDHGERDVCLRFDLTVPLARFVVQHRHNLGLPFKRYAIGSAFRGENPQFGRYREFTQCDFDFIGTDSITADAEIVLVARALLTALGVNEFTIKLGSRRVLNGLAILLGLEGQATEFIRILDKLNKLGKAATFELLTSELKLTPERLAILSELLDISQRFENPAQMLDCAQSTFPKNEAIERGLNELASVCSIVNETQGLAGRYTIDFSLARGFGYYTGLICEAVLDKLPELGSVCGGGRYDNLTQNFSAEKLPGVGASVGLDRLITGLLELGLLTMRQTLARVLVAVMEEKAFGYAHAIAQQLRSRGVATEVYPESTKLKKQFQYADRKGHAYVLVIGPDEYQKKLVTVKALQTGAQEDLIPFEKALALVSV